MSQMMFHKHLPNRPKGTYVTLSACAVYSELYATGLFEEMSVTTDEDEHSIEMQLPYIAKVMERFVTN